MIKIGQKVKINMMGIDAGMRQNSNGLTVFRDTRDAGTGIIISVAPQEEYSPDDEYPDNLYLVAVIDGRFDPHRNDLGELYVWEKELEIISGTS